MFNVLERISKVHKHCKKGRSKKSCFDFSDLPFIFPYEIVKNIEIIAVIIIVLNTLHCVEFYARMVASLEHYIAH